MGVIVLLMFQLTVLCFPSSRAEEYKFCDAKPLGKYCLSDNSGWRECLIDALDEPAEELHHCPAGLKYVLNSSSTNNGLLTLKSVFYIFVTPDTSGGAR